MAEEHSNQPRDDSRRNFLRNSSLAIGGLVVGGVVGTALTGGFKKKEEAKPETPAQNEKPSVNYNQALMFFSQEQFRLADAAAERIFPKDDIGPGAKELGVAFYIDHQLAGPWGMNARDYMIGPFYKAEATQGYQSSFKRHELITNGLMAMKEYSQKKYSKSFEELGEAEQDEVLKVLEKGEEVQSYGLSSKVFFSMFRSLTIEGVYADPLYGGNQNMMGWKMKNYPGDQMSYYNVIEQDAPFRIEPSSLHNHMNH
ncbi:gluconate 2-dehydrogenase subunit 3 family protein [Paenibacillus contaminans]|uniref:Gluconate 2-dehydrogenase subunit 3 family protein n=1 Tax=Paenibacillus contaminans TaxID=450362 RepID=A0A329MLB4_9BACL|nr:gluconate 2-dehydrogenase subunit 3 family protein [Paenibacillus contaminans]RAV20358.1 gluconate 2-dehydrogenase subunit 3 family protein [Paenibacillus contaminans]